MQDVAEGSMGDRGRTFCKEQGRPGQGHEDAADMEASGKCLLQEEQPPGLRLRGRRGHSTLEEPGVVGPGGHPGVCGAMLVDAVGKT